MRVPNIEAERERKGLSNKELAEKLGVSIRTVYNWQKGITDIPASMLVRLSNLFGKSTDYLLGLSKK